MAKLDEIKEEIGSIKVYLGFIIAFIISIASGILKVFENKEMAFFLYVGVIGIIVLSLIFAFLAKSMHEKIKSLRNI